MADSYISRCRKAGIRKVFPRRYLRHVIIKIKSGESAPAQTAWKALNDRRWIKQR
ncbi:hypothetical protein [Microtetraspora sp. NBRC 13810]|uniref:hypothetical protein n=1 Tax=Microtetraspora sp. NBRC 13810 TaxID=3030990 RepID=UPI002553DED6|nr:hypothetical protein [Microtetraspora sp. NBRC 13810]